MIKPAGYIITCLLLVSVFSPVSFATEKGFQVFYRSCLSLNGEWKVIVDPYENGYYNYRWEPFDQMTVPWASGYYADKKPESPSELIEYNFDDSKSLQVPGDWNTQSPQLYYYEGTIWYRKKFDAPVSQTTRSRFFLYFGAANYKADVYLNGKKLGTHVGGFTPFYFEITGMLKEKDNSLVVKVDNKRVKEGVPTLNTDWWNYGGITREVKLVKVPVSFIINYKINLESVTSNRITGKVILDGAKEGENVTITIPELKIIQKIKAELDGIAEFSFTLKKINYWSPENPKLYRVEISTESDRLIDSVGFRTIAVIGKQVLLNNKLVFLKGISIHEDYSATGGGRVKNADEAHSLLSWAKELGCNFVRLAHYPHNEDMVRIADRMGLMVWSEIPVYWTIDWENEATFENARSQLTTNILRDQNRASIVIWSISNETPVNNSRNKFLFRLAKQAKLLDSTRLISAAMEKHYRTDNPSIAVIEDPLAEVVDLVSFNEYIGWYDGLPEKCQQVTWSIPYNKPVFISEFGADAKYGFHGPKDQRWTEEFQEDLYINTLQMLDKIEGLCGMSPWILADFRSPRRVLPGIQDDYNRKGLVSEKGEKKKAFFVLKKYYDQKAIK
jgi:beta-glucuronidase